MLRKRSGYGKFPAGGKKSDFPACHLNADSYTTHFFGQNGVWLSLVERYVRDVEVAGSNPVTPTILQVFGSEEAFPGPPNGEIAQSVEQGIENPRVPSSILGLATTLNLRFAPEVFFVPRPCRSKMVLKQTSKGWRGIVDSAVL